MLGSIRLVGFRGLAGAPVGLSEKLAQDFTKSNILNLGDECATTTHRLFHPITSLSLLSSISQTKPNYIARASPPSWSLPALRDVSQLVRNTHASILDHSRLRDQSSEGSHLELALIALWRLELQRLERSCSCILPLESCLQHPILQDSLPQ